MKNFKRYHEEVAPTNATGSAVVGTGDDDSTVVVKKKPKVYKRKKRMTDKEIEEARNYRSEYDNYHSKPEQREKNAARLRARRLMIKNGKAARGDGKDVHHKDNDPLNNEEDNLKVTDRSWNRREPRLRKEESIDEKRKGKGSKNPEGSMKGILQTRQAIKNIESARDAAVEKVKKELPKLEKQLKDKISAYYKKFGEWPTVTEATIMYEEVEESINIDERKLTDTELKRREEIAKDLNDADFKKRYGDRWKEVKMGVATNMAKKESVKEQDDPKADKVKSKELKIAKAIAQAQLAIAKEQERVQKLTDIQKKIKDQAAEETIMSKKYLKTKTGSLEEAALGIWQSAAEELDKLNVEGGFANAPKGMKFPTSGVADRNKFPQQLVRKAIEIAKKHQDQMTIATKKIEKLKRGLSDDPEVKAALQHYNEQMEDAPAKVDGRTKQYKETLRRIQLRKERMKKEAVEEATIDEGKKGLRYRGAPAELRARQLLNRDTESMVVKKNKVIVIDKKDEPEYLKKGWQLAEEDIHELYSVEFTFKSDRDAKAAAAFVQKHASPGKLETEINGKAVEFYRVGGDDKELRSVKAEVEQKFKRQLTDTKVQNEETIRTEGSKEEYQKFFNAALKKFGAKSPADMDDEKKKKFFDYVDKNWKGEGEKKESVVSEKIQYVEYQFRNKNEAMAAKKFFDGQQRMGFEVNDDNISNGELAVDAGKNDMTKYHEAIVKKLKPKVIAKENEKKEVKEATKYKFPTLSSDKDEVADAKKIAAKLKRVYKDTKIKLTPGGAAGGGPGWEISFTDKEDNPAKVLKALQKTGYDDGDMSVDDIEPYAEGFEKKKVTEAVDKDAARELEIYIENDQKLYKQKLIPIVKNIQKKIASGKYDHKKAPKLWMYLVDEAAKKYIKDHGSRGEKIDSIFNKETRMAVAQNLADNYRDEIEAQGGTMFESLDEIAEAKYDIYHKTYSAAVQHAAAQAKKRGYEVDQDSWDSQITHGERKPSTGNTVSKKVALTKNGKPQRKKLQIQVHAMSSGKYELNMYIEEVDEIAEAAIDDLKKIVKDSQHGKVSGVKVDLFSASAMIQVFDALNDKNKKKVEKMLKDKRGVMTFAKFAMSQVK